MAEPSSRPTARLEFPDNDRVRALCGVHGEHLKLVERRLIEQAKGRLMRHQGLDEEQAYRLMRSTAMSRHLSLGELARQLLQALPA